MDARAGVGVGWRGGTRRRALLAPGTRRRALLALPAALAAIALVPPPARAALGDAAATQAYIQANYSLVVAAASQIRPIEARLRGVLARVRHECPRGAANSPQDSDSEALSNEVIGALVTAAAPLIAPAARRFNRAAGRLTWSNAGLTRAVHAYVDKGGRLIALAQPRLCADVASWAASGFAALPASTVSFDAAFMPNWVAPGELPAGLAPYETAAERPLVARTAHLESEFTELEAREVETWGDIMNALELWP